MPRKCKPLPQPQPQPQSTNWWPRINHEPTVVVSRDGRVFYVTAVAVHGEMPMLHVKMVAPATAPLARPRMCKQNLESRISNSQRPPSRRTHSLIHVDILVFSRHFGFHVEITMFLMLRWSRWPHPSQISPGGPGLANLPFTHTAHTRTDVQ